MSSVKDKLLEASFEEVFSSGYNGTSLDNILKRAEVKKGAMYHYFGSKKEMILTMLELKLEERIERRWKALRDDGINIIDTIISIIKDTKSFDLTNGCPLGNLLQESLDNDEEFHTLLNKVLDNWKQLFDKALQNGKSKNHIRANISTHQCATFIIASIEGAILLAKKSNDTKDFEDSMKELSNYLLTLKS